MDTIAIPVLNCPVEIPVSKSITNQALLVADLAPSDSILENALFSEDSRLLSLALRFQAL